MRSMSQLLWAVFSLLIAVGFSQDICGECQCKRTYDLNSTSYDDIECSDKNWLRLTDREHDLLNTTFFFAAKNVPLYLLDEPARDFSGVPSNQLRIVMFIETEIVEIPDNYFAHDLFSNLTEIHVSVCTTFSSRFDLSKLEDLADVLDQVSRASSLNELVLTRSPFPSVQRKMFLVNKLNERLQGLNIGKNDFHLPLTQDLFEDFKGQRLSALSLHGLAVGTDVSFLEQLLSPIKTQLQLLDLADVGLRTIPPSLKEFVELKELLLSENAIVSLEPSGMEPVMRCVIYTDPYDSQTGLFNDKLTMLTLNQNQLETLDTRYLPTTLETLDVSSNRISDLKYGFTKFNQLIDLDISSNKVKAILPDFSSPYHNPNLTYISFSNNRLGTISEDWLEAYHSAVNNGSLTSLGLAISQNPYSCRCGMAPIYRHVLNGSLFQHTDDVEDIICYMPDFQATPRNIYREIVLDCTSIEEITDYSNCTAEYICDSSTINHLHCADSHLPIIPTSFPGTPWYVDMSNNDIRTLTPSYLDIDSGAAGIITLDLSYNVIGPSINSSHLGRLKQLKVLNLRHNRIENIGVHTFINNTNLESIDLSSNYITNICHEYGKGSLWYSLALPSTQLDLSHNLIRGLPCNAFSMRHSTDTGPTILLPNKVTWKFLDLSYNCIDMNMTLKSGDSSDFYQPPAGTWSGVSRISGKLDLSHNYIKNFTYLMEVELKHLTCTTQLDIEYNLVERIADDVILGSLKKKWAQCGSNLKIGNNPYDCTCPAIDFWIYYNQSSLQDLKYLNSTSLMNCETPSKLSGQILYELNYPSCACESGSNPCFVYGPDPKYYAECIEVLYSNPPQAKCGHCPEGFKGDGVSCAVVDPCVTAPCFVHPEDLQLAAECTLIGPNNYTCGSCPLGMTGSGYGPQGCQNIDMCQIYKCYSDVYVTLNCTDEPPPSSLVSCDQCPPGLVSALDGEDCLVPGQCCQDDDPCTDVNSNRCFREQTCTNQVWPQTGYTCGDCPHGTEDLKSSLPGRYCVEINGCDRNPCYNQSATPAVCTDILWTTLTEEDDPYMVSCSCAPGTTGAGWGVFGCHDIDGCMLEPCWEDQASLGVRAVCEDVMSYPDMSDEFEVTCTCPDGMVGDGLTSCNDTDPCSGDSNPCFDVNSCIVVSPPIDTVACGPCQKGYTGDGRVCTDIDECATASVQPPCHDSLACAPTPAPHDEGQYSCLGDCPSGMIRSAGGQGQDGCIALDLCKPNPCSEESSCRMNLTSVPAVSCGLCRAGAHPLPDCDRPGTKSCCVSSENFSFRLSGTSAPGRETRSVAGSSLGQGHLQVFYNGVWGDVVYYTLPDLQQQQMMLTATADSICRHLGYRTGRSTNATSRSAGLPLLTLMCKELGLDIMACDWSAFHNNNSNCSIPNNRHLIQCGHGVSGYQLLGSTLPSNGIAYISYYPSLSLWDTLTLPICYVDNSDLYQTAASICLNLKYSGLVEEMKPVSVSSSAQCVHMVGGLLMSTLDLTAALYVKCYVKPEGFRLVGKENYLQVQVGDDSSHTDRLGWGYLPAAHYMQLSPGFQTNKDWDDKCRSLGYNHMVTIATANVSENNVTCKYWNYRSNLGHQLEPGCSGQEMIQLECASSQLEVRIVDRSNTPASRGRVEIKLDGVWSTLTTLNSSKMDSGLATAICLTSGYQSASWWVAYAEVTVAEILTEYGQSEGGAEAILSDDITCRTGTNHLLRCENSWTQRRNSSDPVKSLYGRWTSATSGTGYPVIVSCQHEHDLFHLRHGHYGEATVYEQLGWKAMCVAFNPLCAEEHVGSGIYPDSRLATFVCKNLGYRSGFAIPMKMHLPVELPSMVYGRECSSGHCEKEIRPCNLTGGDYLLSVRCYDGYDACSPQTNTCFWKESCVDLPQGNYRLCQCPPGYEGNGYVCNDIDECSADRNPCHNKSSCVSVPAPLTLGAVPAGTPNCSACPQGTEDADAANPGRVCLEKNGCIPSMCSRPEQCTDVKENADGSPGYTCDECGEGYVSSSAVECIDGTKPVGSKDCCIDGDACVDQPCGPNLQCLDLPAPASVITGYTCGACPPGTQRNRTSQKCQDIDFCEMSRTPCDEKAFCEDLPPPSMTAMCRCYAGYAQNTTGVKGRCPPIDICADDVCGVGRNCTDWDPPIGPDLMGAPEITCSACLPGYVGGPAYSLTIEEYNEGIEMNGTVAIDCVEYDACAVTPPPCYRFPGNVAYDVECVDTPAKNRTEDGVEYSCGPCPPGMTGSGYGPAGCNNIDSCAGNPCDNIALECVDYTVPLDGFNCICPAGTVGVGAGNSSCIELDACQVGNNSCMFPELCSDLPYTSERDFTCACPLGMHPISERSCADIDGCIQTPCYGTCVDVPYNDSMIAKNPNSNGTDVICAPCPRGMYGDGIGRDGCTEIDLCLSSPLSDLLCYNDSNSTGLHATCTDVPHEELLVSETDDLYRCVCPPGMTGDGYGPSGCTNIDYCEQDVCSENEVCIDYPPPSTKYTCDCASGYTRQPVTKACVDADYCNEVFRPCDSRMQCDELAPPSEPFSNYFPIVHCTSCPLGTLGREKTVYLVNGQVIDPAVCTEINGCQYNDTCWINPLTRESLCRDVPSSSLRPWNTGYEIECERCPHGMEGSGDSSTPQKGCVEINGCVKNGCFVGVECIDIPWYQLSSTQPADDFICGECPGELRGDGRTCLGGCDFESNMCDGNFTGSPSWYRERGSLSHRTIENIDEELGEGAAPLFDHTYPFSSKGYYLTLDVHKMAEMSTSSFSLPLIRGPASVRVLFYAMYNGRRDGVLYVRQHFLDGSYKTLWLNDYDRGSRWFGVERVLALSNQDFTISFEFERLGSSASTSVAQDSKLYIALDDIFLDRLENWQCNHNQLCYKAELCMRHSEGTEQAKGYTCYCEEGYTGTYCETKVDRCASSPCHGQATCVSTPDGDYICQCPSPATGKDCYIDTDECAINQVVCAHGGTCHNLPGSYQCTCSSGFTGRHCEINVDDCLTVDCGKGRCYDLLDGYQCVCDDGWKGLRCEVNEQQCSNSPCQHGSLCTDLSGPFQCHCRPGYTGRLCEVDINECQDVHCQQGATCLDLVNGFQCDCPPGYSGKKCERDIAECVQNGCSNHGACYEGISDANCLCAQPGCRDQLDCRYRAGRYLCDCDAGYTGKRCEGMVDYCLSNPCIHGDCEAALGGYTCTCDPGWQGKNCEWEKKHCDSEPCKNLGKCINLEQNFKCICMPGYGEKDCSLNIDDCVDNECVNGGVCKDRVDGYDCQCASGYVGEFCQLYVTAVIEKANTSSIEKEATSLPTTALANSRFEIIYAYQNSASSSQCDSFTDVSRDLKTEIVGYSLLVLVVTIIFLLCWALCRVKSSKDSSQSGPVHYRTPVTRYVDRYPFYGGRWDKPFRSVPEETYIPRKLSRRRPTSLSGELFS